MRAVLFNGSARIGGNTFNLLEIVAEELKAEGVETEIVQLGGKPLSGCIACYQCFKKKDKRCAVTTDAINDHIEKMLAADAIILGSPTYFADASVLIKALIERAGMVARANEEMFARKVGAGVVAVRRAGAFHVFSTLNAFFTIGQMFVVGSSYWNIGRGREKGEVMADEEGVKTMRDLGRNTAWLLKKIHA